MRPARNENITLAVEEKFSMTAYKIETKLLRELISKLSVKLHKLSEDLNSWDMEETESPSLEYINCLVDLLFTSK